MSQRFEEPPLCVDLDGTLIAVDSLKFSLLQLGMTRPWRLLPLALRVRHGRARFKRLVTDEILPDPRRLPYRTAVVELLEEEQRRGRRLIMVTAADERVGQIVADYLGLFDTVLGSDGESNLKGASKLLAIRRHLGCGEFDYIGDHISDLAVLSAARRAFLVRPSRALLHATRGSCRIERILR